ncbi:MAG: efflux RND transporter periplasmic adaptor subunit [Polyangiaceae bacterium]|nr:efflux RND transporter periplasmic adaptor subunit [Polyangiaceae bacterium]
MPTESTPDEQAPDPPPRGIRTMEIARRVVLAFAIVAALWAWALVWRGSRGGDASSGGLHAAGHATTRYRCPMHPQIVSDEPGECPICHMTLQPAAEVGAAPSARPAPPSPETPLRPGQVPPGTVPITLDFDRRQSIGLRTALAEERDAAGTLRATATVVAPEQGAAEVHVRAAGFVERISVPETGVRVGTGQELLGVYSPEVFQAESELLAAKSFGDQGAASVAASRQRLELLGMQPRAIDDVLRSGRAMRVVPVIAPAGGYVSKKNVVLGSYVTPETALYEIVDLRKVYVVADLFQRDAASIGVGTQGRFVPAGRPGEALSASVDLVYPKLDAEARTTRVRMKIDNAGLALRPGQYGDVEFAARPRKAVVVPRDAVVDTGRAVYVFVDEGGGLLSPREVVLGRDLDDAFEVTAGVAAGDRVVSGATFLVDSESRLQASLVEAEH